MSRRGPNPAVVFGFFGFGVVVLLAAAGGGSPVQGASTVGGILRSKLGQFFTLAELVRSTAAERLGLDNTPPPAAQANLERLVAKVLDPLRTHLGRPVRITSGFRSAAVNKALDGSPTSQHMLGEAVDIKADGLTAVELATVILRLGVPVDQVIWYDPERGGHVHVSYTETRPNRRESLHAPAGGGYLRWKPAATPRVA
jgi:zinc D-Ala-D-Ala carboxypeptidase